MIQLLEQIAREQYDMKALADNQVKVNPKNCECFGITVKAVVEKRTEFHTYKLEEERRVLLKNIHYSPETLFFCFWYAFLLEAG
jgi:hypothetical protein